VRQIVAGLLVLLAAGGMGITRITARNGGTRSPPFRLDVRGCRRHGPGSGLFFSGLLLGAAAMLGLSMMAAALGRGFKRAPGLLAAPEGARDEVPEVSGVIGPGDGPYLDWPFPPGRHQG
jgi:hypothetical protein